jgi:hypothetical protein
MGHITHVGVNRERKRNRGVGKDAGEDAQRRNPREVGRVQVGVNRKVSMTRRNP